MAMVGSRTIKVAQYCLLPQIFPRLSALLFSGFGFFAYFIAQLYRGVRLLPEGHPFLNPSSIGHFSIPQVVAAAGARLKYRRENIDQVLIFYVILLGLVLLVLQAALLIVSLFAPQAMAFSLGDYFGDSHKAGVGNDPYQDLAFIMLDRVFGIPGIFQSCVSEGQPCYMAAPDDTWDAAATVYTPATFPWPFHEALHAMLSFYSTGLLVVAMLLILYFVVVIVAETAQTGVPFGRRFNKVYAPLRLVFALGLLIPISYGLNTAQYIVLYSAKLGSNFATNAWNQFNSQLSDGMMFSEDMIASPKAPNVGDLLQFMTLAHACKAIQEGVLVQENPEKFSGANGCGVNIADQQNDAVINAYLVRRTLGNAGDDAVTLEETSYQEARDFFGDGDMTISFGDRGCTSNHNTNAGHTIPLCGQLSLGNVTQETDSTSGSYIIQQGYYELIQYMWGGYGDMDNANVWAHWGFCNGTIGGTLVHNYATKQYAQMIAPSLAMGDQELRRRSLYYVSDLCPPEPVPGVNTDTGLLIDAEPTKDWVQGTYNNYMYGDGTDYPNLIQPVANYSPSAATYIVTNIIRDGIIAERQRVQNGLYAIPIDLLDRGWAGAGLWYNKVAAANGAISGSAYALPKVMHFPELMEKVAEAKLHNNANVSMEDLYVPSKGKDSSLQFHRVGEEQSANALARVYGAWRGIGSEFKPKTGNVFYDFLNWLFGTEGLFDLRDPANAGTHPLALLTSMGKSLLDASIRNIGIGMVGEIAAPFLGQGEAFASVAGSILFMIVGITLGAGVVLYYVLPFMPFVYFFFAVGSWLKSVFEAIVAVPLWALAHIRIDGEGLPGSAALNGYYMIFEIFLRPIVTLFGLVAAVSTFAAMATVLNAIFDIAVINVGGTNFQNKDMLTFMEFARGPVDQLFYTAMYAVIMYIMAMASFKLIDIIPNQIMRWMGAGISSFAGMTGDSAYNMMNTMQIHGTSSVSQAVSGLRDFSGGAGKAAAGLLKSGGS